MPGALDGVTVVDLSDGMAGALFTMMMCDNGARVIRLERPGAGTDRQTSLYRMLDRGKESVFLDLDGALADATASVPRNGGPLADFDALVGIADVLVDTLLPSSPFQALVDYQRLEEKNPGLVRCSITSYGQHGPHRDEPPLDDLVMARTGILTVQPAFRLGPVHVVHPIPSIGAAMLATQGTVAALIARERTGRGRHVNTSLMGGVLANSPKAQGESLKPWSGRQQRPTGDWPFYSVFRCSDGRWLQIGCIHDGFVNRAVDALGIRDAVSELDIGTRYAQPDEENRAKVYDVVARAFATRPRDEWAEAMEEADVPYAPILSTDDAVADSQAIHNEMFVEVDDPELGRTTQVGLPVKLLKTPGSITASAPRPGEHTETVLAGLRAADASPRTQPQPAGPDGPPLEGVRVLGIDNVIAGPMSTRLLADLGADVVKLEPPGGEISRPSGSSQFSSFNCNKRSVAVNGKEPDGQEIVRRLGAWADAISENMRSGAAARIGLSPEVLDEVNPSVAYTHITGFGSNGPYSHRPGLDPLAQAMAGLQVAQAGPGNPPVYLGMLAPGDYVAAMIGTVGTVLGLFARARTGVGQRSETCLLNAGILVALMGRDRAGDSGQYGRHALSRLYETGEGWLYVVVESEDEWQAMCRVLQRPDLPADPRFSTPQARLEHDSALADELGSVFTQRTAGDWVDALRDASVPAAPAVEHYEAGFFSDPQASANRMVSEHQDSPLGPVKFSSHLVDFSNTRDVASRVTPQLGEHNREVLSELGYSEAEIESLYARGIINTDAPPS